MILKLTDEFLDQYHIKDKSYYNDNYYRIPFCIRWDNRDYDILRIECDEYSNTYQYSLCYELDGELESDRYIAPSSAEREHYELDLNSCSKEMIWY